MVVMVMMVVVLRWRGGGAHPPAVGLGDVCVQVNDQVAHAHVPLLVVILEVGGLLSRSARAGSLLRWCWGLLLLLFLLRLLLMLLLRLLQRLLL